MTDMRVSEYSWIRFEMSNKTMEEKREHIMAEAQKLTENAKEDGFAYASIEMLKKSICIAMDWVSIYESGTHAGRKCYRVNCMTEDQKVGKTIENMIAKGYIEISKSGKGFKVLKTK